MVAKNPNKPVLEDVTLDEGVKKNLDVQGFDSSRPESASRQLNTIEQGTLKHCREKYTRFWKTVRGYEKILTARGDDEFTQLKTQMTDLQEGMSQRLRALSRTTADRYLRLTARYNVATRVLASMKHQSVMDGKLKQLFADGDAGMREQFVADHPWMSRVPLVRSALQARIPSKDSILNKAKAINYDKLKSAAQNVKSKAKTQMNSMDKKVQKRFGNENSKIRKTEDRLRKVLLEYDKGLVGDMEEMLRKAGSGDPLDVITAIDTLKMGSHDPSKFEEDKTRMKSWARALAAKSNRPSKAFDVAGRVELNGSTTEVMTQMRGLPLGTKVRIKIPGAAGLDTEMVLSSKTPNNYLLFQFQDGPYRRQLVLDSKQKFAWLTRPERSQALQDALGVADEITEEMIKYNVLEKGDDGSLTSEEIQFKQKIRRAVKQSMLKAGATKDSVRDALKAVLGRLPKGSTLKTRLQAETGGKTAQEHLLEMVQAESDAKLPTPPRKNAADSWEKDSETFYAGAVDFDALQFQLPEHATLKP